MVKPCSNEAYDTQWKLIGAKDVKHVKCDGYANCYSFSQAKKTMYLFYYPEILNFIGWIMSGITLLIYSIMGIILKKKSFNS